MAFLLQSRYSSAFKPIRIRQTIVNKVTQTVLFIYCKWYSVPLLTIIEPRHLKFKDRITDIEMHLVIYTFNLFLTTEGPGKRGHIVADTLLPKQLFPRLPARATFVADTNFVSGTQKMFLILFRNILCSQQMFPSVRGLRNIMGNNVSATMCPRLPGPWYWTNYAESNQ